MNHGESSGAFSLCGPSAVRVWQVAKLVALAGGDDVEESGALGGEVEVAKGGKTMGPHGTIFLLWRNPRAFSDFRCQASTIRLYYVGQVLDSKDRIPNEINAPEGKLCWFDVLLESGCSSQLLQSFAMSVLVGSGSAGQVRGRAGDLAEYFWEGQGRAAAVWALQEMSTMVGTSTTTTD